MIPPTAMSFFVSKSAPATQSPAARSFFRDLIIFTTGFSKGQLLAVHPGRITTPARVLDRQRSRCHNHNSNADLYLAWKSKRNVPCKPSVQLSGELLFMWTNPARRVAWKRQTGVEVWREAHPAIRRIIPRPRCLPTGASISSPRKGKVNVVQASRDFKSSAETLGDASWPLPRSADGR